MELRPHLAIVFSEMAKWLCSFERRPMLLDETLVNRVAEMHFGEGDGVAAPQDDLVAPADKASLMQMLQ